MVLFASVNIGSLKCGTFSHLPCSTTYNVMHLFFEVQYC
nr:MAG TPA: hypothetical protein [Caudoviricetes sp.]